MKRLNYFRASFSGAILCGFASMAAAERMAFGLIPYTNEPRIGNNLTILSEHGEQFEGRAWFSKRGGFFCFSGAETTCGGRYDATSTREDLTFEFQCLDGRKGQGIARRQVDSRGAANVLAAEGSFADSAKFVATFGPEKEFLNGVGCWY